MRFTMRTLLVVTAGVALIAAIVGPYLRDLRPDEQLRALAACGSWLAMLAIWMCIAAWRRLMVERLAGKVILRLPIYGIDYHWRRVNLLLLSAGLALYGLVCLFLIVERAIRAATIHGALAEAFRFSSIVMAGLAAHSVALWWWSHHARLSEAGILWDRRLIRWKDINQSWDSESEILTFLGTDQQGNDLRCEVIVPESLQVAVKAIVEERLQWNGWPVMETKELADPCPTIR